jgi:asparagine synthase (glutamine-hydrolysing)
MCGIAGIRVRQGRNVTKPRLLQMAAALHHRGPDSMGTWVGDGIGFAHTRLAIIDLASSEQPMAGLGGHTHLVFNGEIFNYQELRRSLDYPFHTHGDTEVLLALYHHSGVDGVANLRGQFAYAIHDSATDQLHLFRDRLGVLPLFYYVDQDTFAFASEIKALLAILEQPLLDQDSIQDYLAHRSVPSPHTFFQGIRQVPPGHHLVVDSNLQIQIAPYWLLHPSHTDLFFSDSDAIDAVDQHLSASVSESLVSDVPLGIYLSGGVDSSLITALVRNHHGQELHTFGASFADPRFDESSWASQVATIYGTNHHNIHVTADDFIDNWSLLSWHRDGPLSEPADVAIYRLACHARQHVKVVLSGEGSDEIFAGYPKYSFAQLTRWISTLPHSTILRFLSSTPLGSNPQLSIALRALAERAYAERLRGWFAPFSTQERERLTGFSIARQPPIPYRVGRWDSLSRMLSADTCVWLPDNLLQRADRMSMAASLETRPPFLDHRLVELAFHLPTSLKIRGRTRKWILKSVARRYLPAQIVDRPKIGFKVPLDTWFRSGLRGMATDLLTGPSSYVANNFDRQFVSTLLSNHSKGIRDEQARIWTLLSFEVWVREMNVRGYL